MIWITRSFDSHGPPVYSAAYVFSFGASPTLLISLGLETQWVLF